MTLSMNGAPVLTDARGEARVPWMAQELKWVSVRRDGYCPIPEVPVREARPVTVVLPPHRREDGPCPTVLERLMHGTAP